MANIPGVVLSRHPTLAISTVDTVTFAQDWNNVEVLNRHATDDIYATVGAAGSIATPAVSGDDTYIIRAGQALPIPVPTQGATVVKLISASAAPYSVTGLA
ncbi:MAG: hypothetical protein JWM93_108 [Frankiales bacterium]|nr:hypothetical protein [Frankiales bacterium]